MESPTYILLCGNRLAIPVMRSLLFQNKLAAIIIPEKCKAFIEQVDILLKGAGIPIISVNEKSTSKVLAATIKKHKVTVGLIVTYSYKLPPEVYNLPSLGFFNIHPGPLPEYRGPDPIFQQIVRREKKIGLSIHKLDSGFDSGDVVLTDFTSLAAEDTYGIAMTKLSELAADMLAVLMRIFEFSSLIPARKQVSTKVAFYQKQSAEDVVIYWQEMTADEIVALINACNPWNNGAATSINNIQLKLLIAEKESTIDHSNEKPGAIIEIDSDEITIATLNNEALVVKTIYMDEGFLAAGRLSAIGVIVGDAFN